jgi:hypothetical protein
VVRLTNFRAAVQLYNFRLAGKKKIVRAAAAGCARRSLLSSALPQIKMLAAILSPSRVSLCVESREIRIPMVYNRAVSSS